MTDIEDLSQAVEAQNRVIARKDAEIERLTAVLKAIANYPHNAPDLIRAVARNELDRALEQKP